MRITAQKLKEIVEDAISFYNEYQSNLGGSGNYGFPKDYLISADIEDLDNRCFHNNEILEYNNYLVGAARGTFVAYKDKNINVDFTTSMVFNERHQYIKKLPKEKKVRMKDGNIKTFKYVLVRESFKELAKHDAYFYLECKDMEELPEVFKDLLMLPNKNKEMTIIGNKLKSFKNLFRCDFIDEIKFTSHNLPSFETFEHLKECATPPRKIIFGMNVNNFNGLQKFENKKTTIDISTTTNINSFYGLPVHDAADIFNRTSLHSNSNEVMEAFNNYFDIITKHKDLYEDPVKDNIMKVYNPKTVAIFDMYYNNMENYKGIDINLINKLTYHLLK